VKRLIKALESARGNGTSMISLILPPKDQVSVCSCYHTNNFAVETASSSSSSLLGMISIILPPKDQAKYLYIEYLYLTHTPLRQPVAAKQGR
jgi:peptide chain release factor subunit 1